MVEWRLTPEYILENWSNEKLNIMVEKLVERKQREADAYSGKSSVGNSMPEDQFFKQAGIKVVKK